MLYNKYFLYDNNGVSSLIICYNNYFVILTCCYEHLQDADKKPFFLHDFKMKNLDSLHKKKSK